MRILVVEDEADMLRRLAKILRTEGYAVDTAVDGEEGLYKALESDYDAILLDAMMPVIDGWELLVRLRKTKATPVLMLTARDTSVDRVRGLDNGADDYVVKPFDLPELLARVRALIRRGAVAAGAKLDFGEVAVDTAQRCVWRRGEVVALLPSEYALLEYFMRNAGRILTETQIIEHVWDMNYDGMANTVNVYIHHLRNKIDRAHDIKLLHTIRSRGYVMKEMP
jgi:two-component system OmpR family response regulator